MQNLLQFITPCNVDKLQFAYCCQISLQHLILNLHWKTISNFKEFTSVYHALHCCQTSVHHLLPNFIDHCHTVKCHCVLPHCSSDISYFMFAWQYKIADLAVSLDWCRLVTCHVLKYEPSTTPSRPGLHQSLATIDQFETWSASLLMLTTCLGYCSRISRGWDEVWEKERETGMRWGSLMLLFTHCPLMRFVLCYSPQHLASSDMASDWLHLPTQHLPIPRIWPLPQCWSE